MKYALSVGEMITKCIIFLINWLLFCIILLIVYCLCYLFYVVFEIA